MTMEKITSPIVEGIFPPEQAIAPISDLYAVKIRFHELMIQGNDLEEDIKMRERKIKNLRDMCENLIASIKCSNKPVILKGWIELSR
jgi:hypothetical protein